MRKSLLSILFVFAIFSLANAQFTSVGLIGSATPDGWDADTNMVQTSDSTWTLTITLTTGAVKFRADDAWDINWGAETFPFGTGTQGGPDIPVDIAGTYNVEFNSNSGAYYLEYNSNIGILGSALPFSWDRDVNLWPDTTAGADTNMFFIQLDLVMGAAKFRQDDDWAVNWGATDFPMGTGTQGGPDIPVANAGNYTIYFNKGTGDYNFSENVTFANVGIVGSATPDGDTPTAMTKDGEDANLWSVSVDLVDGELEFTANNGEVTWGGTDFPSGVATEFGPKIPVTAGKYKIDFNTSTGVYTFTEVIIYASVGIIGDATPIGNFEEDVDMVRQPGDSSQWQLRVELNNGFLKFRANDDWAVNWGDSEFPSGTAFQNGPDIPITEGEYIIDFNSFTGAYNFRELIIYDTVSIIGTSSPFGNWDDDVIMTQSDADENIWILQSVTLSDHNGASDGGIKFRADLDWTVNWGAADWPTGIGTQDGDNIVAVGGDWGVVFNSATGEYTFSEPLTSTEDILKPGSIKAFPNPTSDVLNIDMLDTPIKGEVSLRVFDMRGQLLIDQRVFATDIIRLDVSSLQTGNYTLQVRNDSYIVGKQFVVTGR